MKLVLIRGLPGSGKSTIAKELTDIHTGAPFFHVEADMWFCRHNGEYVFVPQEIHQAHDWCQKQAALALERGENVVVSNTFSRFWEMEPYIKMAKTLGAEIFLLTADGKYGNVHGVPQHVIERMKGRWENLSPTQLKEFVA